MWKKIYSKNQKYNVCVTIYRRGKHMWSHGTFWWMLSSSQAISTKSNWKEVIAVSDLIFLIKRVEWIYNIFWHLWYILNNFLSISMYLIIFPIFSLFKGTPFNFDIHWEDSSLFELEGLFIFTCSLHHWFLFPWAFCTSPDTLFSLGSWQKFTY